MNRNKDKIQKRSQYVKEFVNEYSGKSTKAIRILSEKLFLSEKTIWNDLKK